MANLEIYCDGRLLELGTGFSGVRMNAVVFDPTQLKGKQGEYSFTFKVPSTRENDITFGHANIPSQPNKFRRRYDAEVYAEGILIFSGSLTVNAYENGEYSCNLVSIKVNSNSDIFGDSTLNEITVYVPFEGASTINAVNASTSSQYYFPLVSYGAFVKDPYAKDEVGADYTPKGTIDKYNKFWYESFYPSVNVLETVRRAYQMKGYKVAGSAFNDPVLREIFASCHLGNEQVPIYNLGNDKFGRVRLSASTDTDSSDFVMQDLTFPYYKMKGYVNSDAGGEVNYNFTTVDVWNLMNNDTERLAPSYLYDTSTDDKWADGCVVVPSDGFYRITLEVSGRCNTTESFNALQWVNTFDPDAIYTQSAITITPNILDTTPIEIQLVRNYDGNLELIKGRNNIRYHTGNPSQQTYTAHDRLHPSTTLPNMEEWLTCFPHQDLYGSESPTDTGELAQEVGRRSGTNFERVGGWTITERTNSQNQTGRTSATASTTTATDRGGNGRRAASRTDGASTLSALDTLGYVNEANTIFPYDPAVSPIFICGFSTMAGGTASVIKDGRSYVRANGTENSAFYKQNGMTLMTYDSTAGTTAYTATNFGSNSYAEAPNSYMVVNKVQGTFRGKLTCCVKLEKDDVIQLLAAQRNYGTNLKYDYDLTYNLDIKAMSQKSKAELVSESFNYNSPTQFPSQLNLGNFMSNDVKIADWIDNVCKAFNLSIYEYGNIIEINKGSYSAKSVRNAVELDGKADIENAKLSHIDYPRSMAVKWTINKDEWGFERTVPQEHINDVDWYKYGDSGYTVISLNDDSYSTSTIEEQVPFSYCYWQDFRFVDYDIDGEETGSTYLQMPVIELSQYMAEGYGYEQAMQHDGYSLAQRFWFRPASTGKSVKLADSMAETVNLYVPTRIYNDLNISYKDTEKSLLTEYFNLNPMLSSNYAEIDVYLTNEEFIQLRGGALAHLDSDLYYTGEISGFDPTGKEPTTLKLVKKM